VTVLGTAVICCVEVRVITWKS